MKHPNPNPQPYEWDYDGACRPTNGTSHYSFSVGVFQWIPKRRGGLKRGKVVKRISGSVSNELEVYGKAQGEIEARNKTNIGDIGARNGEA